MEIVAGLIVIVIAVPVVVTGPGYVAALILEHLANEEDR